MHTHTHTHTHSLTHTQGPAYTFWGVFHPLVLAYLAAYFLRVGAWLD